MMIRRYAVVKICTDGTGYIESRHIFLFRAINRMTDRQNELGHQSWSWGAQMGLLDQKRKVLLPVDVMIDKGAAAWRREE